MELSQKRNNSAINRLLSSFVPAQPDSTVPVDDNGEYLQVQPLLPRIEFDTYLCCSFDERLMLELESVGLGLTHKEDPHLESTIFGHEIEHFERELNDIRPRVESMFQDVMDKLPAFREDEARRVAAREEFLDLMKDSKRRCSKR
jgi:hypothetical protein